MKIESALRDEYRKLAKDQGYRSRSSYKLLELIKKYNVVKVNDSILDIGCAPGGWLQVSKKYSGVNGQVVGIDKSPVIPLAGISVIQVDIEDSNVLQIIKQRFPILYDVVLSDLSPNVSGIWHYDHERQISLTLLALDISTKVLKVGGNAIFKIFEGEFSGNVKQTACRVFKNVTTNKPKASRQKSSEFYLVCSSFCGTINNP
ncbi:MAG TPA: RlmE family RNA methyltransferase [Nitrososphaeraceae archaeon]|nr:RlmE family RNA methyltransferase [Nitrososphaeraceae archaeon]